MNAAGFYDTRGIGSAYGAKGGVLGEVTLGRFRPGVELFAKHVIVDDTQLLSGVGAIVAVTSQLDVRADVHVGLTSAADDVIASLWIADKLAVR